MNQRWKRGIALATVAVTCLAVAACGGGGEGEAKSDGVVQYMTWESVETNQLIDKVVKEKWKNDKVKLERIDAPSGDYSKKLGTLAQARKLPDIFWCGPDTARQYLQSGLLMDITSHMGEQLSEDDFDGLDKWKSEEGLGGLPSLRNVYGVWYNADLFKEAGVDLPKPGWTWDDMYAAAEKLTGKGGSKYGLAADTLVMVNSPYTMSLYSVSAGGAPFAADINNPSKLVIDDKFTEGFEKLRAAIEKGAVTPPDYDQSNMASLFAGGQQPMMISGQWQVQALQAHAKGFEWGWAPMPVQGTATATYDSIGMCASANGKDDATFEAMAFLQKEVMPQVMEDTMVAPTAYVPGRDGYMKALEAAGLDTVKETVDYGVSAEKLVGLRLTTAYASQIDELTTAIYLPILKGERPVTDLQEYVDGVNKIRESQ